MVVQHMEFLYTESNHWPIQLDMEYCHRQQFSKVSNTQRYSVTSSAWSLFTEDRLTFSIQSMWPTLDPHFLVQKVLSRLAYIAAFSSGFQNKLQSHIIQIKLWIFCSSSVESTKQTNTIYGPPRPTSHTQCLSLPEGLINYLFLPSACLQLWKHRERSFKQTIMHGWWAAFWGSEIMQAQCKQMAISHILFSTHVLKLQIRKQRETMTTNMHHCK